jgi:hypothetical protein
MANVLKDTNITGELLSTGQITAGSGANVLTNAAGLLDGGKLQAGTVANAAITNSTLTLAKFASASLSQQIAWSPSLTAGTNVASIGSADGSYTRAGDQVIGQFVTTITPSAANNVTEFTLTPPIAATFSNARRVSLVGIATHTGGVDSGWRGLANTSTNLIDVRGRSFDTGSHNIVFILIYRIS